MSVHVYPNRERQITVRFTGHFRILGPQYGTWCRSHWPRGLTRRSAAARLLRSWVRIPPGALMFVCCEYCVLSGRGLCDELITRSEESYRLWCVVVCDLETSRMRKTWPALGRSATKKKNKVWNLMHVALTAHGIWRWPLDLPFMGPCIVSVFQYISNKMLLYTVYLYPETALHVSGGTSTHHQGRIQLYLQHLVFVTPLLLPAASSNGVTNTRCCRYSCMRSRWWVEVPPETCRAVSR